MMTAKSARMGWLMAALMLLPLGARPVQASDVVIYTENYPPYNFTDMDGTVTGLNTAKVRQVMARSGLSYDIVVLPWARALRRARTEKNAFIYSIARIPEREKHFDWLVPLAPSNFFLFARTDEKRPVSTAALQKGLFLAACVSGDVTCDLMRSLGIPESKLIVLTDRGTNDFRLVIAGRADLYMSDKNANVRLRRMEGYDPALTKPVFGLGTRAGFYLAAGKQVSADLRGKVHAAYMALMKAGKYHMEDAPGPGKSGPKKSGPGK
ncbi:substrate-binding periplasmic protein [Kordiimonas marina]|uniref:substrate-binding periplasmic protein n=1 Tax=Kordiimonas marina TaxID=2872312 RepID=UPI001FF45278|nr:transporter substrate-binding domain-containing protein [Kordiimonas marina]MCJ9430702.1 transporter substrate-binding domain-containing protein [Kordiimonas marina]